MRTSLTHIAGVGISSLKSSYLPETTESALIDHATTAGTQALLDAGITYNDVDSAITCSLNRSLPIPPACFEAFGKTGCPISEVDNVSGLRIAAQAIASGQSNCTMMIGMDKVGTTENRLIS